jgi:hypothetical protein
MVVEALRQGCEKSPLAPGRCAGVNDHKGAPSRVLHVSWGHNRWASVTVA